MTAAVSRQEVYGFFGTLSELLRIAQRAILASKMRSFLTVLGIIIGVLSVVAVVSIIQGVFASIFAEFNSLGGDTMFVRPNYEMFTSRAEGVRRLKMRYEDAVAIKEGAPNEVKDVAPFIMQTDTIAYRGRRSTSQVIGTTEPYAPINNSFTQEGRFIGPMDVAARRKVCVIGLDILDKLDLPAQCVGTEIQIGRGTYTIVGVQEKKGGSFGQSQDDIIYIPLTTGIQQYGSSAGDSVFILIQARDSRRIDETVERVSGVLRRAHGIKFDQQDDFRVFTVEEARKMIKQFTNISFLIVTAVVSITLLVGGIGIMNIMLVSVTERTREIGIRMAVGAKRASILSQFLIESVTLSTLGGIIGLLMGVGISHLTVFILHKTASPNFPAANIPLWIVLLSLCFAAATGAIFGVYPAYKASRLDPIDALRYE
jgi:putative ABC transport system permease protein